MAGSATGHTSEALHHEFHTTIRNAQPDQVMEALLDPRYEQLVQSLPQSVFVEVFRLLSPAYFVEPYRDIHRPLHPTAVAIKKYRSLSSILGTYAHNLIAIVHIRQSAGHIMGLAEYTHLLDCARSIGDAELADNIWSNMHEDEVIPDVHCYNYYMAAKVWDRAYAGHERYHLRVTPFAYRKRRMDAPNPGFQGYGTAGRSVRKEVLGIFNEMVANGNQADEASLVNVLLAASRVGYVQGIKSVLKTAWNVDVDELLAQNDESLVPPVTEYDRSSPLHPSGALLFAVAHAFGTNNDIAAALRTVNFIASSYDIPIPEKVWLELLERSFVLSRPRFGPDAKRDRKGKVNYDFLGVLVQTMASEPFNVRYTIEMHHVLAKCAWDRARLRDFQHHMRAAYDLLQETRRDLHRARRVIQRGLGYKPSRAAPVLPSSINPALLQSAKYADAIHEYEILRWRTAQQTIFMERFAKLLLIHNRWTGRNNPVWERHLLPQALEEWRDFVPQSFSYSTRGGQIALHGKIHWGHARLTAHKHVPTRRPTVENGIALDEGRGQLDDCHFWDQLQESLPQLVRDLPPLQRLFQGLAWEPELHGGEMVYEGFAPMEPGALHEHSAEYSQQHHQEYIQQPRPHTQRHHQRHHQRHPQGYPQQDPQRHPQQQLQEAPHEDPTIPDGFSIA